MKEIKKYLVEELDPKDTCEIVGGTFGYDVGWAIHWAYAGAFSGINPGALAGAVVAYVNNNP
jgi:hypothetical protein